MMSGVFIAAYPLRDLLGFIIRRGIKVVSLNTETLKSRYNAAERKIMENSILFSEQKNLRILNLLKKEIENTNSEGQIDG